MNNENTEGQINSPYLTTLKNHDESKDNSPFRIVNPNCEDQMGYFITMKGYTPTGYDACVTNICDRDTYRIPLGVEIEVFPEVKQLVEGYFEAIESLDKK